MRYAIGGMRYAISYRLSRILDLANATDEGQGTISITEIVLPTVPGSMKRR